MLDATKIKALQESTGHSVFSPSSMKRIMLCPGSVLAELKAPIPDESPYAAKGTLLHGYCEEAFTNDPVNPVGYVGAQMWENDDKVYVMDALEYVKKIQALHFGEVQITLEAKGSLASWGLPEIYGTMDVKMVSERRVDVLDYKFGHGIQVFAEDNPQCGCYLGGAVPYNRGNYPTAELNVHIVQPTLNHYDVWPVPYQKLMNLIIIQIQDAITEAKSVDPSYAPSMEACRFCNANMTCEHRAKGIRERANMVVKAAKNPDTILASEWKKYLDAADDLQQAIKDIRIYAQDQIRKGFGFPGYKLIAGRSTRYFKDAEISKKFLEEAVGADKLYVPGKMVSPAQAEKLNRNLKKDPKFLELITKSTGIPVLQPESHGAPAIQFSMQNEFMDEAKEIGWVKTDTVELKADPFA